MIFKNKTTEKIPCWNCEYMNWGCPLLKKFVKVWQESFQKEDAISGVTFKCKKFKRIKR